MPTLRCCLVQAALLLTLAARAPADDDSYTQCIAATGEGCNARETTFLEKMKGKSVSEIKAQKLRLRKMDKKSMKEELADWIDRRLRICRHLAPDSPQVATAAAAAAAAAVDDTPRRRLRTACAATTTRPRITASTTTARCHLRCRI